MKSNDMTPERKKTVITIGFYLVVAVLIASFFCSCQKDDDEELVPLTEHVLFVYIGGDNNLSSEAYQKITAMQKGWDGNVSRKIVIYTDPENDTPSLIEITRENGQNTQKVIRRYEEENSANSNTLEKAIREVKSLYPSLSYGLLVFSHASGWLPKGTLKNPKSLIIDGTDEMELTDFASAIPDKAFDYIVLEMCFSTGIEVAYELKDKANYILASSAEIVSPGFTNIYAVAINDLLNKDLKSFAMKVHNHIEQKQGDYRSSTLSIIKTSALPTLASYIKQYCDFNRNIKVNEIQRFDRLRYRLFFDFGDYYSRLLETDSQKQELEWLINGCIVWKAATSRFMPNSEGFDIKEHSGMTTYIIQKEFPVMNEIYRDLSWTKATGYRNIIGWN